MRSVYFTNLINKTTDILQVNIVAILCGKYKKQTILPKFCDLDILHSTEICLDWGDKGYFDFRKCVINPFLGYFKILRGTNECGIENEVTGWSRIVMISSISV